MKTGFNLLQASRENSTVGVIKARGAAVVGLVVAIVENIFALIAKGAAYVAFKVGAPKQWYEYCSVWSNNAAVAGITFLQIACGSPSVELQRIEALSRPQDVNSTGNDDDDLLDI